MLNFAAAAAAAFVFAATARSVRFAMISIGDDDFICSQQFLLKMSMLMLLYHKHWHICIFASRSASAFRTAKMPHKNYSLRMMILMTMTSINYNNYYFVHGEQ